MIARNEWTGPAGPVLLGQLTPEELAACVAEVKQITEWAPLGMMDKSIPTDWRAYALYGYSTDPLNVHNLWYRLPEGRLADEARLSQPEDIVPTTAAPQFPTCCHVANDLFGKNERVRILVVGKHSTIPKHEDPARFPKWEDRRIVRLHIPLIVPSSDYVFRAWDRDGMESTPCNVAGQIWFIDTDTAHEVINDSDEDRYHLVVDKFLTPQLRSLLKADA